MVQMVRSAGLEEGADGSAGPVEGADLLGRKFFLRSRGLITTFSNA